MQGLQVGVMEGEGLAAAARQLLPILKGTYPFTVVNDTGDAAGSFVVE